MLDRQAPKQARYRRDSRRIGRFASRSAPQTRQSTQRKLPIPRQPSTNRSALPEPHVGSANPFLSANQLKNPIKVNRTAYVRIAPHKPPTKPRANFVCVNLRMASINNSPAKRDYSPMVFINSIRSATISISSRPRSAKLASLAANCASKSCGITLAA